MILATGIVPRQPAIEGLAHRASRATSTSSRDAATAGRNVAIIGAGGIGFDVAEFLTHAGAEDGHASAGALHDGAIEAFRDEWGIDAAYAEAWRIEAPRRAPAVA